MVKINTEINEIRRRKAKWYHKKQRASSKGNIISKSLCRQRKDAVTKIRNENEYITTDSKTQNRIIRKKYEQLNTKKFDALDERHKFLETQNLLNLNHKDTYNLNRSVSNKDIKSVIKFISWQKKILT